MNATELEFDHSLSQRFPIWLIKFGIPWALFTLTIATVSEPTAENITLFIAILSSGLYTLLLRLTRPLWLYKLSSEPLRNAALLGIFNAALIETLFLLVEKICGAEGVAAHPNLLIDLLLTMPWYTAMVITFVRVQNRRRFTSATVLLLGALYELGGDGFIGQIIGIPLGTSQLLDLEFWIMLVLLVFWQFILVYSSMLLPPSWLIELEPNPGPPVGSTWRDALRPMLWLIPFTAYLLSVLVLMGSIAS
ncbi:MAG: hypothetical protein PVG02_08365 [Anaerolineales bacterium]|jgi:hypothetical protein